MQMVSMAVFLAYFENVRNLKKINFGPRVYPRGSYVITHVRPSVGPSVRPSLNISETVNWFFLIFCVKLGHDKWYKSYRAQF